MAKKQKEFRWHLLVAEKLARTTYPLLCSAECNLEGIRTGTGTVFFHRTQFLREERSEYGMIIYQVPRLDDWYRLMTLGTLFLV